tara:strand:- start:7 stop:1101 length:1095 start_codon:yes stop_codon:yes gene_type:complete
LKIIYFIESLGPGGKERRLVSLIQGMIRQFKANCELVLLENNIHYDAIYSLGVKIHLIERRYIKKDPRPFFLFYSIVKKFNPDIIHAWGNMPAIYAIPTKLLLRLPLIDNEITDAPNNFKFNLLSHRLVFPFSDLIIANSKAGLKVYNAPIQKGKVIYNGFDFDRLKNLKKSTDIKLDLNILTKYIVCMVATFSIKKDYFTFISAACKVLKKKYNTTFLCIGDGDSHSSKQLVEDEYKSRIKFLGKQDNVESIINTIDIGVLMSNSKTHGEGISNSIMEYMALGKPVICSESGGNKELIVNQSTGYIIKPGSVDDLADKIMYLLDNSDLANSMGKRGRSRIKNNFKYSKMIVEYYDSYDSLGSR